MPQNRRCGQYPHGGRSYRWQNPAVLRVVTAAATAALALAAATSATPPGVNGAIAFLAARGSTQQIAVVAPDGRRTTLPLRGSDPSWSPDGARIAFAAQGAIWIANADGSAPARITRRSSTQDPAWSPDGTRIAFARAVGGNQDIYVVATNGSALTRLTSARGPDHEPAWSPDGARIAFSSRRSRNWELYAMNADGSQERRLTRTPDAEGFPAWSPDGRRIAYWRRAPGRTADLFTANADGREARRLTRHPANDVDPAWSPDGTKLVFASDRTGFRQLYVLDVRRATVARLSAAPEAQDYPDWQRLPPPPPPS